MYSKIKNTYKDTGTLRFYPCDSLSGHLYNIVLSSCIHYIMLPTISHPFQAIFRSTRSQPFLLLQQARAQRSEGQQGIHFHGSLTSQATQFWISHTLKG